MIGITDLAEVRFSRLSHPRVRVAPPCGQSADFLFVSLVPSNFTNPDMFVCMSIIPATYIAVCR